ncbi:unnamed protein product [Moneuplotes crassus]|uniref:ABC1 atypical kinase-like domain-containing protein n=1 Tax=Euplotes crassus TaxID=5936 RepID=A0AAD1XCE4_EUPCR|nr:unnamed protein product [Moneuplotes crassus]
MLRYGLKLSPLVIGPWYALSTPQQKKDVVAIGYAGANAARVVPFLVTSIYDYYKSLNMHPYPSEQHDKEKDQCHERVAYKLLSLCVKNRGIYLKLGQYIGSLDTIAPRKYVEVLRVLQDEGPHVPFDDIKIVIENDFGCKLEDLFENFEQTPIAAASLAQVHKAFYKKSKQPVAVKVQFPTLLLQTKYDMVVTRTTVQVINFVASKMGNNSINFLQLFENFKSSRIKELDFTLEFKNGNDTKQHFQGDERIYIPNYIGKPKERVLIMEFIDDAFKINQVDEILNKFGKPLTQEYVCRSLIDIFAKMIFFYGVVHVDGHPGNILVREHPDHPGRPQVVLLDHGHYVRIDDEFRNNFSKLWYSMVTFNKKNIKEIGTQFCGTHYRYLPILFTYRTIDSQKPLGESFRRDEKQLLKVSNDLSLENIGFLLQKLPWDLILIFKACHFVTIHNKKFGIKSRERFFRFTDHCMISLSNNSRMSYYKMKLSFYLKLFFLEYFPRIFRLLYTSTTSD